MAAGESSLRPNPSSVDPRVCRSGMGETKREEPKKAHGKEKNPGAAARVPAARMACAPKGAHRRNGRRSYADPQAGVRLAGALRCRGPDGLRDLPKSRSRREPGAGRRAKQSGGQAKADARPGSCGSAHAPRPASGCTPRPPEDHPRIRPDPRVPQKVRISLASRKAARNRQYHFDGRASGPVGEGFIMVDGGEASFVADGI